MSKNHLIALAAVAALAYTFGYYRAQRAAVAAAAVTPGLAAGSVDWMNWQAV